MRQMISLSLSVMIGAFFFNPSLSQASAVANTESDAEIQYQLTLDKVNQEISQTERDLSCPSAKIALSCGNGQCEPERGENQTTCPQDCVPSLVRAYNRRIICPEVQGLDAPATTLQAQAIIKDASRKQQHIRIVGRSHSANDQFCTKGIAISTENFNHILGIEPFNGEETVLVEAGVTLGDLVEWLNAHGRSLGYAVMGFRGMTVGGAIATGAHGSSPKHNSVISSLVRSVEVVLPNGKIAEYSDLTTDPGTMKAFRVHLGMLGLITRLRLKTYPQFNLNVKVTQGSNKQLLEEEGGVWSQVRSCDYVLINWFPNTGRFIKSCGRETKKTVEPAASNYLLRPSVPPGLIQPFKYALHYADCSPTLNSLLEVLQYLFLTVQPPFKKQTSPGVVLASGNVTGYSNRMMSSDFESLPTGFVQEDWEFAVPVSEANAALKGVYDYIHKNKIYLPLVGLFLRFGLSQDNTLLAHSVSKGYFVRDQPIMYLEFVNPLPMGFTPERFAELSKRYDDLARLLVTKYHARPHWGKNKNFLFALENELNTYEGNLAEFKSIAQKLDPKGLFTNDFSKTAGLSP